MKDDGNKSCYKNDLTNLNINEYDKSGFADLLLNLMVGGIILCRTILENFGALVC